MNDRKPKPPDLDLIQMVQQARMEYDRQAVPSNVSSVYWIESKPLESAPIVTSRAGQWVIETRADVVDELWVKIRQATEAGRLGYKSKVSTFAVKGQSNANDRVIVVRTYDADDSTDVARVQAVLRALGIAEMRYERITET